MSTSGGQPGNNNAVKGRPLTDALRRMLARAGDGDLSVGMNKVAMIAVDAALAGEQWAIKEVWDRIEGKAIQGVELAGVDGGPIVSRVENVIIDAAG